ncbi:MAG: SMC-Scp complex subunit ScpB [Oscillospiraceae bacterium]|nr:SMC-Scp complex subunit ScpB [Oscillospiraceae bacterium]
MELTKLEHIALAVLFAGGDPVPLTRLAQVLECEAEAAARCVDHLNSYLDSEKLPLQILRLDDSFQLSTRAEYQSYIRLALEIKRNQPLSQAAMEVLAIIAYNQPVTRAFVEQIRGVDSSGVMANLAEKQLIEEAGRLELPGRPISYRTTAGFLRSLGLSSLEELPLVPEGGDGGAPEEDGEQLEGQVSFS